MYWSGGRVCNLKPGALVSLSGRSDCELRSLKSGAGTPGPSTELGPDVSRWFLDLLISDSLLPIASISQCLVLVFLAASLARRNIWRRRDALLGSGEQFHKPVRAGRHIGRGRQPKLLHTHARSSSHVIRRAFDALKVTGGRVGAAGRKERTEFRQMRA